MENKNSPAVSIIIPVYNREKYIAECLDSIFAQTFKNFEVVLVDDCSTDNSREIVENYLADFSDKLRIINLEQNSGGPSKPRNIGIKFARGEYIFFVDSDDVIIPTALEELYPLAKKNNVDVLHCPNLYKFSGETLKNSKTKLQSPKYPFDYGIVKDPFVKLVKGTFYGATCAFFYRRNFILENKIIFPGNTMGEDRIFNIQGAFFAKKFLYVKNAVYYYREHLESAMSARKIINGVELFKLRLDAAILATNFVIDFVNRHEYFQQHPDIKFFTYRKFLINPMDPFVSNEKSKEVSMKEREEIVREKIADGIKNKIDWAIYLFLVAIDYRWSHVERGRERDKLKEENKKLKNQIQGTFKLLQEEVKNLQSL